MKQDNDVQGSNDQPSRRIWLMNLVVLGLGSTLWRSSRTDAAGLIAIQEESAQSFMMKAFEMKREAVAAGDQAYGAVVVKEVQHLVAWLPTSIQQPTLRWKLFEMPPFILGVEI